MVGYGLSHIIILEMNNSVLKNDRTVWVDSWVTNKK